MLQNMPKNYKTVSIFRNLKFLKFSLQNMEPVPAGGHFGSRRLEFKAVDVHSTVTFPDGGGPSRTASDIQGWAVTRYIWFHTPDFGFQDQLSVQYNPTWSQVES